MIENQVHLLVLHAQTLRIEENHADHISILLTEIREEIGDIVIIEVEKEAIAKIEGEEMIHNIIMINIKKAGALVLHPLPLQDQIVIHQIVLAADHPNQVLQAPLTLEECARKLNILLFINKL